MEKADKSNLYTMKKSELLKEYSQRTNELARFKTRETKVRTEVQQVLAQNQGTLLDILQRNATNAMNVSTEENPLAPILHSQHQRIHHLHRLLSHCASSQSTMQVAHSQNTSIRTLKSSTLK